jgi:hypothetical protein
MCTGASIAAKYGFLEPFKAHFSTYSAKMRISDFMLTPQRNILTITKYSNKDAAAHE